MKVSSSEKWNESNRTKIAFGQKKNCSYLAITNDVWWNIQNNE